MREHFDIAGSGVGKGNVEELKKMLDQMRDENNNKW
jgi:hypothetical protein